MYRVLTCVSGPLTNCCSKNCEKYEGASEDIDAPLNLNSSLPICIGKTLSCGNILGMSGKYAPRTVTSSSANCGAPFAAPPAWVFIICCFCCCAAAASLCIFSAAGLRNWLVFTLNADGPTGDEVGPGFGAAPPTMAPLLFPATLLSCFVRGRVGGSS